MQNWNAGKTQEFKDRRVYNIGHSVLTHSGPKHTLADAALEAASEAACCAPMQPMVQPDEPKAEAQKTEPADVLLFKTPTCPNCKTAQALLDRAGVRYETVNANEAKDLVERYDVKQAPTLVLLGQDGFEKYRGVSDIKGWLMQRN